jgi:hypothetical protein
MDLLLVWGGHKEQIDAGWAPVAAGLERAGDGGLHPPARLVGSPDLVPQLIAQRAGGAAIVGGSGDAVQQPTLARQQFDDGERLSCVVVWPARPKLGALRDRLRGDHHLSHRAAGQQQAVDDVCGVAPAHIARQVGRVDRPVARTWRAVRPAAEGVTGRVAVDNACGEEGANLEVQVIGCAIAALQHGAEQLAPHDTLALLHAQRWVEMPVHREQRLGMLHNHHAARVVAARVDDLPLADRVHLRARRIALLRVPVLARVPVARVVPRVLGRCAVADEEALAGRLARPADRVAELRRSDRHRSSRRFGRGGGGGARRERGRRLRRCCRCGRCRGRRRAGCCDGRRSVGQAHGRAARCATAPNHQHKHHQRCETALPHDTTANLSKLECRDQDRLALGDHDGMLEGHYQAAILGGERPAVVLLQQARRADRHVWLNGKDQPLGHAPRGTGVESHWHLRVLVQRAAQAVPGQFADDAVAVAAGAAVGSPPDIADRLVEAHGIQRRLEDRPCAVVELLLARRHRRHGHGDRCVGEVAVALRRGVELDEIAGLNDAGARDAVSSLVVHADAGSSREGVGDARCRAGVVLLEDLIGDLIEFGGGDAWPHGFFHRLKRLCHDAPDMSKTFEICR